MNMNEVNESWWVLSLISIKIRQFPWTSAKDIHNKEQIWRVSLSSNLMDVDKVTSQAMIYNVWTRTLSMIWAETLRWLQFIFNSLSIVMAVAKKKKINVAFKRSLNNILRPIYTLELLKWICLLGSLLPERPLLADEEYTLIFLFIFLVSDQSYTIPTQGESHQSVIPLFSVIHRKSRHTDGRPDKQKDSINKRVREETNSHDARRD